MCISVRLGKNGKIFSNLKICPTESSLIKKLVEFIYLKSFLGNTCNLKLNSNIFKLLENGTNINEILLKLKPFSDDFIKNIISSQLNKLILNIKETTGEQKIRHESILKNILKSVGEDFLKNFKTKNNEAGKLIDKVVLNVNFY